MIRISYQFKRGRKTGKKLKGGKLTGFDSCHMSCSTLIVWSALSPSDGGGTSAWSDLSLFITLPSDLFPQINVLIPVSVARGISGNASVCSRSPPATCFRPSAILECRSRFGNDCLYGERWALETCVIKRERKAVRDTMMMAMLASVRCQNINQVMSTVNGEA